MLKQKRGSQTVAVEQSNEESPSTIGQSAGEIPVKATLRKVQQKYTATQVVRVEMRGKSPHTFW